MNTREASHIFPSSPPTDASDSPQDPRIVGAMREYMAALDAGLRPSRREWAARFPEIAEELRECLDGLAFVHSAASQMKADADPALADPADLPAPELATPLGDFRLLREIGRGGMGIVYEADQLSLGRRVAVKVLPFSAALDPRRLQRFRHEAQAAAGLHHTNIVPVYAVGTERSVHFYAMQLIEGESLATLLRRMKPAPRQAAAPAAVAEPPTLSITSSPAAADVPLPQGAAAPKSSALSSLHVQNPTSYFDAVARLALQAARALEYAHSRGVVHRDIKPANLLIDLHGDLWITDFGLAQFYADTDLTCTGDLVGTLAYMSPEQASGKAVLLDQRTDIYSLGVTLYELVTLHRAFPGSSREELLHAVAHLDPRAPRLVDPRIPPELEIIIQKATAKEPLERYQTAGELAEDLRRFLADEHVLARRPTLLQKLHKWHRRHRGLVLTAMCTVLVLCACLFVSTVLIAGEKAKTERAYALEQQRSREAIEQRNRAEKNLEQARRAIDYFARAAEQQMTGNPALRGLRRDFLEHALAYYENLLEDGRANPGTTGELLAAKGHVATILGELSLKDETKRVYRFIGLLSDRAVQEDLDLTDLQLADCQECFGRSLADVARVLHSPNLTMADQQRYQEIAQRADLQFQQILSTEQYERLAQIDRQVRGAAVFNDAEVIQALELSDEQRVAFRRLAGSSRSGREGSSGGRGEGGPGGAGGQPGRGGSEAARNVALRTIRAQLSPGQAAALDVLLGPPLNARVRLPGGGPGPTPTR